MVIITLTTCHNRTDKTLACLNDLHSQTLPQDVEVEHVVVDDSTDISTSQKIITKFPKVKIITGNGSLYWAGGMRLGWENLVRKRDIDFLFVYNDDVRFNNNAISVLLNLAHRTRQRNRNQIFVTVGALSDRKHGKIAYGGLVRAKSWNPLKFQNKAPHHNQNIVYDMDTLNMNAALISKNTLDMLGFLSDKYIHSRADIDYGLRVRQAGGRVIQAGEYIGYCARNPTLRLADTKRYRAAYNMFFSIKQGTLRERVYYHNLHAGFLFATVQVLFWLFFPFIYFVAKFSRLKTALINNAIN